MPKAAYVYRRHGRLWLTAKLLANSPNLRLPDRARELVEGVFSEEARDFIPHDLLIIEDTEDGRDSADISLAGLHSLPPEMGYACGTVPWDEHTPTRLSDESVILRLARWQDGQLRPWAAGGDLLAWELSQVRVRAGRVAGEDPDPGPSLAAALTQAKAAMPDQCRHALLVALEPGEDGSWQGRAVNQKGEKVGITYHMTTGVEII